MEKTITEIDEGVQKLEIDFSDEDVDLQAETTVLGSKADAQRYAPSFEQDMRRQNRQKFPQPEPKAPAELNEDI